MACCLPGTPGVRWYQEGWVRLTHGPLGHWLSPRHLRNICLAKEACMVMLTAPHTSLFLDFFYMYVCDLYIYIYRTSVDLHGDQRRASDPLDLELQRAVGYMVWVPGTKPGSSAKVAGTLNHRGISSTPQALPFNWMPFLKHHLVSASCYLESPAYKPSGTQYPTSSSYLKQGLSNNGWVASIVILSSAGHLCSTIYSAIIYQSCPRHYVNEGVWSGLNKTLVMNAETGILYNLYISPDIYFSSILIWMKVFLSLQ